MLAFYRAKLLERTQALREELGIIDRELDHIESARDFINMIRYFISLTEPHIQNLEERYKEIEDIPESIVEQYTNKLSYLFVIYFRLVGILSRMSRKDVPLELQGSLSRYVQNFLEDYRLLFRSMPQLNYEFIPINEVRNVAVILSELQSTEVASRGNGETQTAGAITPDYSFFIMAIPKAERENILCHAMLGHEIGHGIYQIKAQRIFSRDTPTRTLETAYRVIRNNPDRFRNWIVGSEINEQALIEKSKLIHDFYTNWKEEIGADILAAFLFGPAFLHAHYELMVPVYGLDQCAISHPPNRGRLRIIFKLLTGEYSSSYDYKGLWEDNGFLKERIENIRTICSKDINPSIAEEDDRGISTLVWDIIEDEVPSLILPLQVPIDGFLYTPQRFRKDVDDYSPYLSLDIPIVEKVPVDEKLTIPTILNVGWFIYFKRFDEIDNDKNQTTADTRPEDMPAYCRKLNHLLLKSIELNYIKTMWAIQEVTKES